MHIQISECVLLTDVKTQPFEENESMLSNLVKKSWHDF